MGAILWCEDLLVECFTMPPRNQSWWTWALVIRSSEPRFKCQSSLALIVRVRSSYKSSLWNQTTLLNCEEVKWENESNGSHWYIGIKRGLTGGNRWAQVGVRVPVTHVTLYYRHAMVYYPERIGEIINVMVILTVLYNLYAKLRKFKQQGKITPLCPIGRKL